jgi:pimeloyl-ACP methyl ester carboxylesterase
MYISVAGTTTHYEQMGSGPTLVFLHGWGQDWQCWSPLIGQLSEQFTLVLVDLPGFGSSDCHGQVWNSYQYAEWLKKLITQLGLSPLALIGHSFGGKIAALCTQAYPDSTRQLVLIGAAGIPDPLSPTTTIKQTLISLVPEVIKNALPHQLKTRVLGSLNLSTDNLNSQPHQKKIARLIVQENIANELKKIQVPTLLIWGADDTETPVHQAQQFHQLILGSKLVIIPEADHFVFQAQPTTVLHELHQFLDHA